MRLINGIDLTIQLATCKVYLEGESEWMRGYKDGLTAAFDLVAQAPTIDAKLVVHGKWVDHCVRDWRCSECGEKLMKVRRIDGYCYDDKPNYCPNCGARMDGEA